MDLRRAGLVAACSVLWVCGGSSSPTAPVVAPPGWPAATVLEIVSGESGEPVASAAVKVGGRRYEADADGRVRLEATAVDSTLLDVVAPRFLDRQTLVRSGDGTRLSLWPKESPRALTEHTTAELVYTSAVNCCPAADLGRDPLYRVASRITAFAVVLDQEYRRFPQTVAALEEACRVVAVDSDFLTEGWSHVDTVTLFAHELGHMLGMNHSTASGLMTVLRDVQGVSYLYFRAHRDYSPGEKLALHLMYGRRARNQYPDNDRAAAASLGVTGDRVVCRL